MEPTHAQQDPTSTITTPHIDHQAPPAAPDQNIPGCQYIDPRTGETRFLNPLTQSFRVIPDEFIDMSFIESLTPVSLTEDDGVIKYTDPKPSENSTIDNNSNTTTNSTENSASLPPEALARVRIRFEGRRDNGELLDKQRDRKQMRAFRLHNDNMIPGLHYATASLRPGETAWFRFLPQYHYGQQGHPPLVPENAVLYYKVELVDYTNMKKQLANDDFDGRVELLVESREKGNEAFAKQELDKALKEYKKGLELMNNLPKVLQAKMTEDDRNTLKDFQLKLANNALLVCIKKKLYTEGLKFADIVLNVDNKNSKGLFRKAQCLKGLQYWDAAVKVYEECLEVDKDSREECSKLIDECKKMKESKHKNEMKMYKQVFEKMSEQAEKEEAEKKMKEKIERKKAREQEEEESKDKKHGKDKNSVGIDSLLQGTVIDTAGEQRVKVDLSC